MNPMVNLKLAVFCYLEKGMESIAKALFFGGIRAQNEMFGLNLNQVMKIFKYPQIAAYIEVHFQECQQLTSPCHHCSATQ